MSLTPGAAHQGSQKSLDHKFKCIFPILSNKYFFFFTDFPQFHGVLKLLTSNYEEDSEVDAGVKSGLQLKTLPVPVGWERSGQHSVVVALNKC